MAEKIDYGGPANAATDAMLEAAAVLRNGTAQLNAAIAAPLDAINSGAAQLNAAIAAPISMVNNAAAQLNSVVAALPKTSA